MTGLLVVDPGLWTTIQDLGREGWRAFGVPVAGAMDRESLGLANALAGNPTEAAGLELTLRGGTYEAQGDALGVALAGSRIEAEVVAGGSGRRLATPCSTTLEPGDRLVIGRTLDGARAYLAVAGGILTECRLGSRSIETPVRAGTVLTCDGGRLGTNRLEPGPSSDAPIRLLPGPDSAGLRADLAGRDFRVGSRSDRMGLRLEGDAPVVEAASDRLSAPVAPGAVQATPSGLIVLGPACGTMGGYPHVAQVISADLDLLGRLRPGDPISFEWTTLDEARRADRDARRVFEARRRVIARAARTSG